MGDYYQSDVQFEYNHNKMDHGKRRPQFQIRKVPLRRSPPEKTPQLNALDVHSICLPSRSRKNIGWGTLSQNHYQQQMNPQIISSPAYQQLYSHYLALKQHHIQQRMALQKEIENVQQQICVAEQKKKRLNVMRDGLYVDVEHLRQGLNEVRDKNYNLRWEIYHQRGAHYMNVNGFSLFQGGEMSYEELLQMEEQMGSVPKGLHQQDIALLATAIYADHKKGQTHSASQSGAQMYQSYYHRCCICFDQLSDNDEIMLISCQHLHHRECLRDWLLKQRVCPICKQEVEVPQEG